MLSILLALGAATAPAGVQTAALSPCAPNKHTACSYPAAQKGKYEVPVGKRCHPDSTKSMGCVERLPGQTDRAATSRRESE